MILKTYLKTLCAGAMQLALLVGVMNLLVSCGNNSSQNQEEIVARVYDKYLVQSDIEGIAGPNDSPADSSKRVAEYIDNWIRQQLVLHQAEDNLTKDQMDFRKQIEDYRATLVIYVYEKELVKQKLDTVVLDEEISTYYNSHKEDFQLRDNIVKVLYVKMPRKVITNAVKQFMKSDNPNDRQKLADFCHKNAINFYLDDQSWLLFDDLLKEIPIKTYNQEEYLKNNRFIEIQDSVFSYMLNIKGFMIKESLSPLSFEKENIRSIIVNKRKLALIEEMKQNLYEEAVKRGDFEIKNYSK